MPVGRPPKPTAIRILEGNLGHRPLPAEEPQPAKGVFETPADLSPGALALWESLVPELDRLDLLTIVDGTSLEAACRGADAAKLADAEVSKLLAVVGKGEGNQETYYRLSMLNSVSKKGWQQWKSFATEFGLTPASRVRLSTAPDPRPVGRPRRVDPLEAALCG